MALTDWVADYRPTAGLPAGAVGASTGAAAALVAVAQRPGPVAAVVSPRRPPRPRRRAPALGTPVSAAREAAPQAAREELEAKLIAPDELRLPDLERPDQRATAVRLPGRHLEAIYFDTAELRLTRNGITLRYRSGEDGPAMDSEAPGRQLPRRAPAPRGQLRWHNRRRFPLRPPTWSVPTRGSRPLVPVAPSADRPHAHRDPRSRRAAACRDHRR